MATARYFCSLCRRHYLGERRVCPTDGARLVSVPDARLQPGAIIDQRYVLTEQLAVGGMAAIHRALDRTTRQEVALKVLLGRFAVSPQVIELFYQEARIIRRIRHPNVVALHEFGRTADGYLYMAMELLRGPTLAASLWDSGPPPFDSALRIFFQIVEALRAAHAEGVIHADLKASNVLFVSDAPDERVKVLDFGIARLFEAGPFRVRREDEPPVLGGTPQYMSPEQVAGEEVDPRTDLYAAGILLFQLLTGAVPFDADDPMEVCRMQREERPPRVRDRAPGRMPAAVEDLVDRLLRKDPDDRPPSAERLYEEVKEILRKAGSPTQPVVYEEGIPTEEVPLLTAEVLRAAKAGPPWAEGARVRIVGPDAPSVRPDPEARSVLLTLLDLHFRGDDRPFTLLDRDTVELVTAPFLEAALTELRNAGGVLLARDPWRLRAAFGARSGRPEDGAAAVDLALALLARVETAEATLRIGLAARAGIAAGPVWHHPADRLPLELLVRGSLPDIAQRLAKSAPWHGVVVDGDTYRLKQARLAGARPVRVSARRNRAGITVFEWTGAQPS
jgi:serine/threonine-protein kinase